MAEVIRIKPSTAEVSVSLAELIFLGSPSAVAIVKPAYTIRRRVARPAKPTAQVAIIQTVF